jgi:hypothetical protein
MIARFSVWSLTLASSCYGRLGELEAPIVAVEEFELGTQYGPIEVPSVAVYAKEHLLWTSRMEVVLHHEVQKLSATFAHLVDELRKGDAARDQTLARVAGLELSQSTVGVPDDDTGCDVPDLHCLLHDEGPFLDPY